MWPWLSIVLMSGAGFFTLLDENVLGMKWKLPVGLLLIASSVLGIVMNAQISRWLKEARSAKISGHVWRFVLAALIALTGLYHYGKQRSLAWEDYQKENSAGLNVKMTISAGTTLHFKVIRVDAEGKETPLELQSSLSAPDDQLLHTTLEVGLTERWKKSDRQKLSAILLGLHGDKYSRSVYLDDIWEISRVEEGTESTGDERFELATRHDWLGRKRETLYIETTHTKKQP
jgi:hypothetical protein